MSVAAAEGWAVISLVVRFKIRYLIEIFPMMIFDRF
jgi:hypothetical protein